MNRAGRQYPEFIRWQDELHSLDQYAQEELQPRTSDPRNRNYKLRRLQSTVYHALARELLAMQDGSMEDAIALVDYPLSAEEQETVKYWIVEIAKESE